MKILVTGPEGQIGWELARVLPAHGQVIALGRSQMDLTEPQSIRRWLRDLKPNLIINAAAYTAVDRAETEPALARAVNAEAVAVLAEEAMDLGAAIIHYSTDYIFDGCKKTPYAPDDEPNPQSVYGQTKLEGEQALMASGVAYLILRTCWVYGVRGRNFLLAIVRQAALKKELRIVNDQVGCPTTAAMIARITSEIISCLVADRGEIPRDLRGIHHLACRGSTTWFDFAKRIFELLPIPNTPALVPISTQEYAARAVRPAYSVLDCSSAENTFHVLMDEWNVALEYLLRGDAMEALGVLPPH